MSDRGSSKARTRAGGLFSVVVPSDAASVGGVVRLGVSAGSTAVSTVSWRLHGEEEDEEDPGDGVCARHGGLRDHEGEPEEVEDLGETGEDEGACGDLAAVEMGEGLLDADVGEEDRLEGRMGEAKGGRGEG